jgi:phosphinothricin acetyltransferase
VALHRQLGFTSVGVLHQVGRKFGCWIDTELFELRLD